MRDLYKIFAKLEDMNLSFCFQCQGKSKYYNLSVCDIKGKQHCFNSENVQDIEDNLKVMWGHLLDAPAMPIPTGMPRP